MLAKFKMSLVEGRPLSRNDSSAKPSPPREQRARCSVKKRGYAKSATGQSKPSLQRRQQPTPSARRPSKQPETRPNKQNVMRCLRLNRRRPAMPVTRHGRSNGGGATSPNFSHKGDREAAHLASLAAPYRQTRLSAVKLAGDPNNPVPIADDGAM